MKNICVWLALLLTSGLAMAADEVFVTDEGAIRGYDPVAYFTSGAPVKGDARFVYEWNDVEWRFASADNLATFKSDPEKYAPAFGGFCAYGMSQGYKIGTDPAAFTISDGRLYLNYSLPVRATWLTDKDSYIEKATQNWVELEHTAYEEPKASTE